jgi:hypothetical protein
MAKRTISFIPKDQQAGGNATLVVISCSAAKVHSPRAPLAALDRYDGVFYRVVRKAIRERCLSPGIELVILSAKYGLISPSTRIPFYEQRLTRERAMILGPVVRQKMASLLRRRSYCRLLVNMGRDYEAILREMPELNDAIWATGSIGRRAATLKAWLSGDVSRLVPARAMRRSSTGE